MKLSEIRTVITNDDPYIESILLAIGIVIIVIGVGVTIWLTRTPLP